MKKNSRNEKFSLRSQLNSYNEYLPIPGNNTWLHLTLIRILIKQHTVKK